jgi:hypothetical protein
MTTDPGSGGEGSRSSVGRISASGAAVPALTRICGADAPGEMVIASRCMEPDRATRALHAGAIASVSAATAAIARLRIVRGSTEMELTGCLECAFLCPISYPGGTCDDEGPS